MPEKQYEDVNDLISIAENEVERKGYDDSFVKSVRKYYMSNGTISDKQRKALENIAHEELTKRYEMSLNGRLF